VPSVTANESQAVSAELAAVAAAHPRAQVAWLAGGTIALLKPAFLETLQPTPELEALKKGVFGLPAMGGNLYHSRAELVLLADEDRQPIARYALAADRMQSLAGGRLLALASVARGKGAGATRILAWKDGALHEVATFKQDAGIISEIAGRTFGAAGLEFLGLNEALTKKTRTALQPVAFPEARLTPAPDAPRYVPSEPTRALVGSGGYLSDLRAGGFIFAALWDGRVYRAAIIDETGAAPILRLSEPPVTGTALYYGFSKSASRWIVLPRDGELAFLDPQTGAAQMGPWVVRRTLAETVAMLGDLVALVEQAPGVSGVPFGTLKVLEDGRDVAALDLGIATSLTSLEGLDFVLAAPPRPVLGDGESFLIRLRDERPLRAALEVSAVIPFAVKAAWTADGKLFVTDPADITYESALPPL